jgi:hypothetical protein
MVIEQLRALRDEIGVQELNVMTDHGGLSFEESRRSVNDSSAVSEQQLPSLCRVRRASNPGVRASNPGVSMGTTMCDIPR